MRIVRYIVIAVCGALIISGLLLALLLATLDSDDYRGILKWAAKEYAGYEIRVDGPLSVEWSLTPSLTASEIRIGGEDEAGKPFTAVIGLLRIKVAVMPLLSGTVLVRELQVDDATVSYEGRDGPAAKPDAGPDRRGKPFDRKIPVFESVSMRNIRVAYSVEKTGGPRQAVLRAFRFEEDRDTGLFSIESDGAVEGVDFVIDGRLGSLADALEPKGSYPVNLSLTMGDLRFVISGTIADPKKREGLDIHATAKGSGVSRLARVFGVNLPEQTRLDLDASLAGPAAAPSLSTLTMEIAAVPMFTLSARGSSANLASGEGTDLTISGSCASREMLRRLLPEELHDLSEFAFETRLRERNKEFSLEDLKTTAHQRGEMTVTARGRILLDGTFPALGLKSTDLRMELSASSTIPLRPFLFDWLPETGPVNGEGRLTGPVERLSLEDMDVRAGGPRRHRIAVKGRIGWIPVDPEPPIEGLDLLLSIESGETRSFLAGLAPSLPEFGPARATARLTGSTEIFSLDNVLLDAARPGPVRLVLRGRIGKVVLDGDPQILDIQGSGSLRAGDVSLLSPYLGVRIPDFGPLSAAWTIVDRRGGYGFDDVELVVGDPADYRLKASGRVGTVMRGASPDLEGIDLSVQMRDVDVQAVSELFGRKVTRPGKLRGKFTLSGDRGDLAVSDAELATTSREGIEIAAKGAIRHIRTEGETAVEGIDGKLSAKASGMAPVREITGWDLPDLGSLRLDARISDRDGPLRVDTFRIHADSGQKTTLHVEGSMHPLSGRDERTRKRMTFEAIFETATRPWVETFLRRPVAENHLIRGKMALLGSVGDFRIESLEVASADGRSLSLHADGTVRNITGPVEVDLHATSDIRETGLLGAILGVRFPPIRPVAVDGRIRGSREAIGLDGTIAVGGSRLLVTAGRSLENRRPRIFAKISAPKVDLADLGLSREAASDGPDSPDGKEPAPSGRIFRDEPFSFDLLKRQDLAISLDVDEVIGVHYTFQDLKVHASLDDGLLRISPAGLRYADGFVSVESTIDARGPEPEFALTVTGEDVDVNTLNTHVKAPLIVGGHLNLAVDLKSAGRSPRQIASSLNGDLGIAIENGQVKQIADLIGADAIDFMAAVPRLRKDQKLACFAARFSFEEGIGKSQLIYIDTPSSRSRGAGTVNLPEETIDLVIQPKPKDARVGGSSAITLKGPLRNPSLRKLPFVEAARLFGEITMPYVFLPARAVGYVWYLMKNDKDENSPCLEPPSQTDSGDR